MIEVTFFRQRFVWPKLKRSLTKSYRRATPSNIAATSAGFLSSFARKPRFPGSELLFGDMNIFSLRVGSDYNFKPIKPIQTHKADQLKK
jgi:hypothetical protein